MSVNAKAQIRLASLTRISGYFKPEVLFPYTFPNGSSDSLNYKEIGALLLTEVERWKLGRREGGGGGGGRVDGHGEDIQEYEMRSSTTSLPGCKR